MSASTTLRRTLLTSASFRSGRPSTRFYPVSQPIFSNIRQFSATMAKQGVHNLKNKQEFDEALQEKGLLVLDAFATWCGPCKIIAPQVVK